jgi:hypothetical protein
MGRPLNKRLFGANSKNNIKIQFNNGLNSVPGYIVKQKSNLQFLVADKDGNRAVCKLVNTSSANLQVGQMSITVKYDNGDVQQVVKIAKNLITVYKDELGGSTTGYRQQGWTFNTSTTDQKWQIEEAGTTTTNISTSTGATNYEGDEDPNADYPVPGSGSWQTATAAFTGMSYSLIGSTQTVTAGITSVPNAVPGLLRKKYAGNWEASSGASTTTWNMSFFTTGTIVKSIADTYVSWGNQSDTTAQQNFSMEFLGYVKMPITQNYNWYAEVDDDCAVWIGSRAYTQYNGANVDLYGSNKSMPGSTIVNKNTQLMDSTKWYPIRIWTTEFTGSSKFQIYAIGADGSKYNGSDLQWAYNGTTKGY